MCVQMGCRMSMWSEYSISALQIVTYSQSKLQFAVCQMNSKMVVFIHCTISKSFVGRKGRFKKLLVLSKRGDWARIWASGPGCELVISHEISSPGLGWFTSAKLGNDHFGKKKN